MIIKLLKTKNNKILKIAGWWWGEIIQNTFRTFTLTADLSMKQWKREDSGMIFLKY